MPCRPRWSAETLVTTETSLRVSADALEQDAAAGGLGDRELRPRWCASTRPAPLGPE